MPRRPHDDAVAPNAAERLPPAAAERRQRAAAALNEVVYPMVFFDKIACGGCGLGCLVFPVTALFMKFVGGDTWDTALATATLVALVPSALFVLVIGFQDLIFNRTAARFNQTFPPGSDRRQLAVDLLQDMGEKEDDYRKLLTKLGETPRAAAPAAAPETQVANQLADLSADDQPRVDPPGDDAARSSAAVRDRADARAGRRDSSRVSPLDPVAPQPAGASVPSPADAGRRDVGAAVRGSARGRRPGIIPLDPFTPDEGRDDKPQ